MAVKPDPDRPAVAIDVAKMHRIMNNAAELHRQTLRAVEKWQTFVKLADRVAGSNPGGSTGQMLADREP